MNKKETYDKLLTYCGLENLPEGLSAIYENFTPDEACFLINRTFLSEIFDKYSLPQEKRILFLKALESL